MPRTFAFAPASNRFRSAGLAAAGLGGLLVSSAQATIIHVTPTTAPLFTGAGIDFDGVNSFDLGMGKKGDSPRFDQSSSSDTGQVVVLSGNSLVLDQLPADTLISSASPWSNLIGASNQVLLSAGDWTVGDTGYFGFSFYDESENIHYGWGVVNYDSLTTGSVTEWAYNDVSGESILTGQLVATPVPEPATTGLMAGVVVLCGAAWLSKRRRTQASDVRPAALGSGRSADV